MNHSHPISRGSGNRSADILFMAITVILSVLIIANMVMIWFFSAEDPRASGDRSEGVTDVVVDVVYPDLDSRPPVEQQSILATVHQFIRKLAHFGEFAVLSFLSAALLVHLGRRLKSLRLWMQWLLPALLGLLYAITDEVHQRFTNRGPAVKDVLIDFVGTLVGLGLLHLCAFLVRRIHAAYRRRRGKAMEGTA